MDSVERFSTSELNPSERIHVWNQLLTSRIGPLSLEPEDRSSYVASLYCIRFGEFELLQATSSPALVCCAAGDEDSTTLNLSLQTRGRTTNTTGGRTIVLGPTDFVLCDPLQTLKSHFKESNQTLVLRIPRVAAQQHVPWLSQMIALPMRGSAGGGALLSSLIRGIWQQLSSCDETTWADSLEDVIWSILEMAYSSQKPTMGEMNRRQMRLKTVQSFIDRNLSESDLNAHRIANGVGLSARYVQMLFAEMATTPSAFIVSRRLEFIARQLRVRSGNVPITTLVYDVGFNNLSTFCRAFRRNYGVSARVYRERHRG